MAEVTNALALYVVLLKLPQQNMSSKERTLLRSLNAWVQTHIMEDAIWQLCAQIAPLAIHMNEWTADEFNPSIQEILGLMAVSPATTDTINWNIPACVTQDIIYQYNDEIVREINQPSKHGPHDMINLSVQTGNDLLRASPVFVQNVTAALQSPNTDIPSSQDLENLIEDFGEDTTNAPMLT